ncbi:MAG: thioredoxin family protein [Rhodobacteraceae bacterium]|nr:MAG: thioredoxin family protein [Paracoccaceae bacterium]
MQHACALLVVISAMLGTATGGAAQELRLLMIEQAGCYYCRVFNRDIAPAYMAAPEGIVAPLEHVQLRGPLPEDVTLTSQPFVTPTFILIGPDGVEIERLTGFPGEDFFWAYIGDMIRTAQAQLAPTPEG